MVVDERSIVSAYRGAEERYAAWGVDVSQATDRLRKMAVSIHCWQGDDVRGFERNDSELGGGLAVTGSYPGRARNAAELRADLEWALSCIPGTHRLNLHASYAEPGPTDVDRQALVPEHFQGWIEWAREHQLGLDFNSTFFAHPQAADGWTLTHPQYASRQFWIEHGIACRAIGAAMGRALGSACLHNVWIPDGSKDLPVDRRAPRIRLTDSLDQIFAEAYPADQLLDAVESKLFGIGSESYVAGSHEFYLGYAISRRKWLCLDAGHFHPTESIADKLSAIQPWVPGLLLHVSRGVRWDSDHVVVLNDDLRLIAEEIVQSLATGGSLRVGLDYFDASINRVAAWIIGTRSLLQALLVAFLQPWAKLQEAELERDYTRRLAWQEELKSMPFGAVWDFYCLQSEVPLGSTWLERLRRYEQDVQFRRVGRLN